MQKPIIIEFTGTPNSGKTTLLKALNEILPTAGIKSIVMQEDAEIVPKVIPKKTWTRNVWITLGQLQSLLEAKYHDEDVIFLDRGYYDALFWAGFFCKQNICTFDESDSLIKMLNELDKHFSIKPDYLFVFDVSAEESVRRRQKQSNEPTTMSNDSFITAYRNELNQFIEKLDVNIVRFDTTDMSMLEMEADALSAIVEILKSKK